MSTNADAQTPEALDQRFKQRAHNPNGDAALARLAQGNPVTYRERSTPAGHVLRKHPDGRIELVRVDLDAVGTGVG